MSLFYENINLEDAIVGILEFTYLSTIGNKGITQKWCILKATMKH